VNVVIKSILAAAALGLLVPAAPALADHARPSVRIEVGVVDAAHRRGYDNGPNITARQAARIASSHGAARIYDIDFRRGVWEVKGSTWRGARIELEISARTGRVIDVDYGRGGQGRGRDNDRRDRGGRGGW
jgi:hypothetical protein